MKEEEAQETQGKSTNAEVLRRVHACIRLLNEGYTAYEIVQFISANAQLPDGDPKKQQGFNWQVSERQVYNYCREGFEIIEKQEQPKIKAHYHQALQRWNRMYREAMGNKNYAEARMIQKEIDRLTRIHNIDLDDTPDTGTDESAEFLLPGGVKIKI